MTPTPLPPAAPSALAIDISPQLSAITAAITAANALIASLQAAQAAQAAVRPPMIFGHGRNLSTSASFPQGCDSVRLWDSGVRWALLQPSRGTFNWSPLDARLAECEAHGVAGADILYCFGSTPIWAATAATTTSPGAYDATSNHPPSLADWSNFVAAIVAHVRRADGSYRIRKWELWNETNNPPFWTGTDAQLLAMARAAYGIIKSADPSALVTMPTPTWAATTTYAAIDNYLAQGFQQYADVVTFHGYLADGAAATAIAPIIDSIRAVMARHGCAALPLWDTESGFKGHALVPDALKPQWVAEWLAVRVAKGLAGAWWYQWDNQTNGTMAAATGAVATWGRVWIAMKEASDAR
jgi:polysaccharide biosynthesis protein PslG